MTCTIEIVKIYASLRDNEDDFESANLEMDTCLAKLRHRAPTREDGARRRTELKRRHGQLPMETKLKYL